MARMSVNPIERDGEFKKMRRENMDKLVEALIREVCFYLTRVMNMEPWRIQSLLENETLTNNIKQRIRGWLNESLGIVSPDDLSDAMTKELQQGYSTL